MKTYKLGGILPIPREKRYEEGKVYKVRYMAGKKGMKITYAIYKDYDYRESNFTFKDIVDNSFIWIDEIYAKYQIKEGDQKEFQDFIKE